MVSGMRSPNGASAALLMEALDGRVLLLASVPLILEYEAVLTRAEHVEAAGITVEEARAFVDAIAALAEPIQSRFLWRPQLRDPNEGRADLNEFRRILTRPGGEPPREGDAAT